MESLPAEPVLRARRRTAAAVELNGAYDRLRAAVARLEDESADHLRTLAAAELSRLAELAAAVAD